MPDVTDAEVKKNIAANISHLRGEQSQYALAKQLDIHAIQLSRIERGLHTPGPGLLSRIADAFGVKVDDLISTPQKKIRQRA